MINQSSVKKKLMDEKQDLLKRLESLKESDPFNDPDYANDNAATDTDAREQESHQRIEAEIEALEKRMVNLDLALEENEKGFYGICKKCGTKIPEKRLDLVPEAIYCVECEGRLLK